MNFRSTSVARLVSAVALALAGLTSMSAAHADGRFVISADGQEVTDTQTKLVWQRCAVGMKWDGKTCAGKATKMSLAQAKKAQDASNPAWHAPSKEELSSLVNKSQKKPRIDHDAFPATPSGVFWAMRPEANDNLNAWLVDFRSGRVFGNVRKASYFVRLVRTAG